MSFCRRAIVAVLITLSLSPMLSRQALGQVGSGGVRPFVTGFTPVIGRNGRVVGGVVVDGGGVLSTATKATAASFQAVREKALSPLPVDLRKSSGLRRVSLRALDDALAKHRKSGEPLPQEMLFLGGLTRVQYVVVDSKRNDILLAGPAEPWRIAADGAVVGKESGSPILQLEDFLVAFRVAADGGESASCSIDPTPDGTRRMQKLLSNPRLRYSEVVRKRLESALGPQTITIRGVASTSRLAHVMLAADFQMKRLAMQLDPAAPSKPESYLQLLGKSGKRPRNAAPRWWMAPNYSAIRHNQDHSVWKLDGLGVKAFYEDGFARADGEIIDAGGENAAAALWANEFNREFAALSRHYPVFADLRNCIDLSVVSSLIWSKQLMTAAECELPMLSESGDIQPVAYAAPREVASRASLARFGRDVIVAVSGGVEIDAWSVVDQTSLDEKLDVEKLTIRRRVSQRWVWD